MSHTARAVLGPSPNSGVAVIDKSREAHGCCGEIAAAQHVRTESATRGATTRQTLTPEVRSLADRPCTSWNTQAHGPPCGSAPRKRLRPVPPGVSERSLPGSFLAGSRRLERLAPRHCGAAGPSLAGRAGGQPAGPAAGGTGPAGRRNGRRHVAAGREAPATRGDQFLV